MNDVFYAYELTWEEFQAEQLKGTPITSMEGHLICGRDRRCEPKEAWRLYSAELIKAMAADKPLREEVIRSHNDVIIPMIDGAKAPVSSAPGPESLSFL